MNVQRQFTAETSAQIQSILLNIQQVILQPKDPFLNVLASNIEHVIQVIAQGQIQLGELQRLGDTLNCVPRKLQMSGQSPAVAASLVQALHQVLGSMDPLRPPTALSGFGATNFGFATGASGAHSNVRAASPSVSVSAQPQLEKLRQPLLDKVATELSRISEQLAQLDAKPQEVAGKIQIQQQTISQNIAEAGQMIAATQNQHAQGIHQTQADLAERVYQNMKLQDQIQDDENYIAQNLDAIRKQLSGYQQGLRQRQIKLAERLRAQEFELQQNEQRTRQLTTRTQEKQTGYYSSGDMIRLSTLF